MTHSWNEIFEYNPEIGELRWKIRPGEKTAARIGDIAGCKSGGGSSI